MTVEGAPPRAGRREWLGLAVLGLPTLLVSLDIGALFLALPHLSADLHASTVQQLWITDIYGFLLSGFLITMGTLGDRIGRRRLLLIGAALFGVLSILAAYSSNPEMLIISRALLGVAGATLMPSTLALISNMFRDPKQMGTAIAAWVSCMMAGAAIGPVIGGLLLDHFWWGSVFLLGVPVMVLLLVVGPVLLPESRNPNPGKLDLVSVALSLVAILPIIYGLKELAVDGGRSPWGPIASIVIGAAVGVVFARRQLRLEHPLLDLRLFGNRVFSSTLTSMLIAAGAMAGAFLLVSQYVQSVLGMSPAEAGLWLAPTGLSIALGSQLAPRLAKWLTPGVAITGGLVFGALGFVLLSFAQSTGGLVLVVVGISAVHLGAGPLFALGAGVVMSSVPPERAGSAASMSETANHFGTAIGLAVLGTIGTAIYRQDMIDSVPAGVPADAAKAAEETIGGATAAAGNLSGGAGETLLTTARDAFTDGLNTVTVIGAAVFVALAVVITFAHRRKAAVAAAEPEPEREAVPESI